MQFSRMTVSLFSLLVGVCLYGNVPAQQKPSITPTAELALEITGEDRQPFEFVLLKTPSMFLGGYPTVPGWIPPPDQSPASGVLIKLKIENDQLETELFVQLENEKKLEVGTYRLKENESVLTARLASFGFKPLTLRLKQPKIVITPPSPTPEVTNDLRAVQIVGMYKGESLHDGYKLSLLNVSPKNIIAIFFSTSNARGKGGGGPFNTGTKDSPLIKSGEIGTENIGDGRNVDYPPPGSVGLASRAQWISVRTVVFDDWTYEGDAAQAAWFEASTVGSRAQLIRIIKLLKGSVAEIATEQVVSLDALKEQAFALGTDPEPALVEELISRYPALTAEEKENISSAVKGGMSSGRHEIVGMIETFEALKKASPEKANVSIWLKQTIATFETEVAGK